MDKLEMYEFTDLNASREKRRERVAQGLVEKGEGVLAFGGIMKMEAVVDYDAVDATELTLKTGDIILFKDIDESGWAQGTIEGRGTGWFPLDCVRTPGTNLRTATKHQAISTTPILLKRKTTEEDLVRFFDHKRPPKEDLERTNILPTCSAPSSSSSSSSSGGGGGGGGGSHGGGGGGGGEVSVQVAMAQKKLETQKKISVLSKFLSARKDRTLRKNTKTNTTGIKVPANGIFGLELGTLMELQGGQWEIPFIALQCMEWLRINALDEEGLFRLSGSWKTLETLKKSFKTGIEPIDFSKLCPHDVAGLLKVFLRELPEPLLTFELYEPIMAALEDQDLNRRNEKLGAALLALPEHNSIFLDYLFKFLHKVARHSANNKMDASNLSIIFTPTLIKPKVTTTENLLCPLGGQLIAHFIEKGGLSLSSL